MALLNLATFAALQWVYVNGIARLFGAEGYTITLGGVTEAVNTSKLVLASVLAFLLPLTIRPSRRPSALFLYVALVLASVPMLVLYASADLRHEFMIENVAAFLILQAICRMAPLEIGERPAFDSRFMLAASVLALFAFVASFLAFDGFRYLNFDLSRVYDLRAEARENLPGIYGYLSSIVTKALIPFAMVLACVHRAAWLALVVAACSVLLFALTANKAPLFFPLVVLCVYYFYPFGRVSAWFVFAVLCAAVLSGVALYLYLATGSQLGLWIVALLGNRSLMLPALINYAYYDQFAHGVQYWWSESRLGLGLVERPFLEASPNLIGMNYFGRVETYANTGWIGSGYAQAGFAGVALYSVGLGLVLLIIDGFATKFGARVTVAMFIVLVHTMITSSDFVVMFLTHGMLLSLLLARFTDGTDIRSALAGHRPSRASHGQDFVATHR